MSKILGLDLGTNSIGWAVVDYEREYINPNGNRVAVEKFKVPLFTTPLGCQA